MLLLIWTSCEQIYIDFAELRIFIVAASLNKLSNNQISGDAPDLRNSNVTVMDD